MAEGDAIGCAPHRTRWWTRFEATGAPGDFPFCNQLTNQRFFFFKGVFLSCFLDFVFGFSFLGLVSIDFDFSSVLLGIVLMFLCSRHFLSALL